MQRSLDHTENLLKYKPDIVVHGDVDENTLIVIIEDDIPIGDTFPPSPASPPEAGSGFIDEPIAGFFDDLLAANSRRTVHRRKCCGF